jgi:hypothetical protein
MTCSFLKYSEVLDLLEPAMLTLFSEAKLFEQFQFTTLIRVCANQNKKFYDNILQGNLML